jgi:hypothetical protein
MTSPGLLPADGPRPSGAEATCALAWRLYAKYRDASDALLEAICAADWIRAQAGRLVLAVPPGVPDGPGWQRCIGIAERVVGQQPAHFPSRAAMYHRIGATPSWSAELTPLACLEGFLFYELPE